MLVAAESCKRVALKQRGRRRIPTHFRFSFLWGVLCLLCVVWGVRVLALEQTWAAKRSVKNLKRASTFSVMATSVFPSVFVHCASRQE